jgi:8-oxo-dGTP diphosphatase
MVKTTVGAIITNNACNKVSILLTKRNVEPYLGKWCLPGGHIDPNEKAFDAVKREVFEETGMSFTGTFYKYFDEIIPEMNIHAVVLIFSGTATGQLKIQELEVQEAKWFPLPDALKLDLAFYHKDIIETFLVNSGRTINVK